MKRVYGLVFCFLLFTSLSAETQLEKFQRIFSADSGKLVVGSDNLSTVESIEASFQPHAINSISEITESLLSEPGRPYYFKIRSIYKGYDIEAKKALLQDLGKKKPTVTDIAISASFGIDTNVYSLNVMGSETVVATLPKEPNATATFYLVAIRITENDGSTGNESFVYIRFVREIAKPFFEQKRFVVSNAFHYITTDDARVPTQQDVMTTYIVGATTSSDTSVFDPITFLLVDLMDARVAMDKKDVLNEFTFPSVKSKYASEVVFKGQSGTKITVSTDDNVLSEKMSFTGRASAIRNGDKVRVYYTISKDPLEKWEIQAIERL